MKKGILLASILFLSCAAYAQDDYNGKGFFSRVINGEGWLRPGSDGGSSKETMAGVKVNAIKVNLSAIAYNVVALQYERAVAEKFSFALQARYHLDIPFQSATIDPVLDLINDFSDSAKIGNPSLTGYAITPEFRWYPKQTMKGFYLGPYFRYRALEMQLPFSYYNDGGTFVEEGTGLVGKNNSIIFGLIIGTHFEIAKRISLDIWIGGPQYGTTTGDITYTSTNPLTTNEIVNIEKGIQDFKDFTGLEFDSFVGPAGVTMETRFAAPGLRMGGINLGYRF